MNNEEILNKYVFESNGYQNITPEGALKFCEAGSVILDVREEYHTVYKKFAVENVLYFPLSQLSVFLEQIPRDNYVIVADASGLHSREAMTLLIEKGFSNVINLAGGMVEWERDGMPLNYDETQKMTGSCMCQLKPRDKKK